MLLPGILLVAETQHGHLLAASAKGERGVPAEATGSIATAALLDTLKSGACVDEWMQDQLIIFMVLASGVSRMVCADEPTLHTRTAMVVAEQLLPGVKFTVKPIMQGTTAVVGGAEGRTLTLIECTGAGVCA